MESAPLPTNEFQRLKATADAGLFDPNPDPELDRLVHGAARVCHAPVSAISFLGADLQYLKARIGVDFDRTPRDVAFCAHAILRPEMFVVTDAREDVRFQDNPLVIGAPYIRFYAGVPITNSEGLALGIICVIDYVPRWLSITQADALKCLARDAGVYLDVRQIAVWGSITSPTCACDN